MSNQLERTCHMPSRSFLPVLHDRRNYVGDRVEASSPEGGGEKKNEREAASRRSADRVTRVARSAVQHHVASENTDSRTPPRRVKVHHGLGESWVREMHGALHHDRHAASSVPVSSRDRYNSLQLAELLSLSQLEAPEKIGITAF